MIFTIYVGIDVAKEKHDCCILQSNNQLFCETFSFTNDSQGFKNLWSAIQKAFGTDETIMRVGLEATGHYSNNLVAFIRKNGVEPVILNPLQVNRYRKSLSLRRTKTDKVDAHCIAQLLLSSQASPTITPSYQIEELKTLTRHRSRLVYQRTRFKISINRLIEILFPELPSIVYSVNQKSTLELLLEMPGAKAISACRIDRLTNILQKGSHGRYDRLKAESIKEAARRSIGSDSAAAAFELQQTIRILDFIQDEIKLLESQIREAVKKIQTPLLSIPGIGSILAAVILSEIGDISRFRTSAQLQAYAGLEPSTYQSGKFQADHTPMVKHGSTYLRWALMQAARLAAIRCPVFRCFMTSKLAQGKHYFAALGHTTKKLIRVIFHILKTNEAFISQV